MKHFLTAFFTLLFMHLVSSQTIISVREKISGESIPFVKVFPEVGQPFLGDIDGRIEISPGVSFFRLSSSGYLDSTYVVSEIDNATVILKLRIQEVDEVTVVPGENPAHRIMDLAIANRKKNDPMANDAFRYDSYTKFVAQIDPAVFKNWSDTITDTSLINTKKFIDRSHLFMIESQSERNFSPPYRDKEEIKSYKVSGFSSPIFATIAQELQSFSFYETQVQISGKTYINPLAFGGTRRYLFVLEDSTFQGEDTVFHIRFRPRKNKSFEGMKGVLYINSNGYAIEKVIAEGAEADLTVQVKIIQEYEFKNGLKWFPKKYSSELEFANASIIIGDSTAKIVATSQTYIRAVEFNPEKQQKSYDNVSVVVQPGAESRKDEDWQKAREYELSEQEKNTYLVIDSLSDAENLDRYVRIFEILGSGKIPVGYFNIPLVRLLGYNNYEGYRLGLGLETSDKLSKYFVVGGYFAYGFRDKSFKWGGDLDLFLYRPKDVRLNIAYKDDVIERGGQTFMRNQNPFFSPQHLSSFYVKYRDRLREGMLSLSFRPIANIQIDGFGAYKRLSFLSDYQFYHEQSTQLEIGQSKFVDQLNVFETGVALQWKLFDKVMVVGNQYISLKKNMPELYIRASKGLTGVWNSDLTYTRFYAQLTHRFPIRGIGHFEYKFVGGQTVGSVPLTFSHRPSNSFSSNFKVNLSISNTFETMGSLGYFLKDQASLFTRLDFMPIKRFSAKWRPQVSLHHALGFGTAIAPLFHVNHPLLLDISKGYFETGLILNNLILKNFGVGAFYHYGPYSSANPMSNIVVKLALTQNF
jgi:hypothetical protein